MANTIKATLLKSRNHRNQITLETLQALGLKKIGTSRVYPDNLAIRGMLAKMSHLLEIEEIKG